MGNFVGKRSGLNVFTDDITGQLMHAEIVVDVAPGKVTTKVGHVRDDVRPAVIASDNRDVIFYQGRVEQAIRAKQYRERPVISHFKTRSIAGVTITDHGFVPCPLCSEFGEPFIDCILCSGDGQIGERNFSNWLEANGHTTVD